MKRLLAGTALLAAFPGLAMAADLARPAPVAAPVYTKAPPPMTYNWSGFYIGGNVGGAWANASETFTNDAGIVDNLSFNPSSVIGGGQVGAQAQFGSIVLGVEGTFSGTSLNQTDPSVFPGGGRTRSLDIQDIATVTGKLGFAMNNWMVYGKGGWADARINTSSANPNPGGSNSSLTQWYSGWTAGGGVDYMVFPNWILGGEFDYYNVTFNNTVTFVPSNTFGSISNSKANVYAATVRLSYLFNWGGPVMSRY